MSRDVLTVGSTMRIPLLYRGEYFQWVERFMNYLEEQTDGEAMINSIKNGDQPLPRVTQVSIAGTTSTEQPPLKDKSMCSLKPYVLNVILEKIIIDLEDEVVNLLEKEKTNLETIESLKSKGFESSENVSSKSKNQTENDCLVVEKECDKKENSKVIAPGMFKLNVSQCVLPISMSKSSCDSNNVEIKLKRKRRKRKSSKQNVKQVDNNVSRANSDFVHFSDLDTFSSVRRPRHRDVIWKKKGSSNTSNIIQICLWVIDLGCSKHMTGNRALLTNFVEKFLGTVRFGNNDFAVIAGYGDVVIGSMTIKKVYYFEGLRHNLFSIG
nr:integrase, catalytic region, zinc finger, CCHC-type, peptidase aspartic, catalytic [Tanacetum cinerariifolium]